MPQLNLYDSHRNQMVQPIIKNYVPPSNLSFAPPTLNAAIGNGPERKPLTDETMSQTSRLLAEQRNDIDRILLIMNDLKREIASMKDSMGEVKALEPAESRIRHRRSSFPEELELLTENVSRLNSRVGDLDGLRLEMIVMKRRVKVLEQGHPPSQSSRTVTGHTPPVIPRPAQPERLMSSLATRQHRPLYPNGAPQHTEPGSPVIASSVESRPASTDLYGVSPEYNARGATENGDIELRNGSASVTSSSMQSSSDSQSELSSSLEPQAPIQPPTTHQSPTTHQPPTMFPPPTVVSKTLNDHDMIRLSDPEDSSYDPDSQRLRTHRQPHGARVCLPTPDWEKPNWTGPPSNPNERPNNSIRPLGAPEPDPKRRKTSSFAEGLGAFSAGLPASWTESSYHSSQAPTQTPSQTQPPWPAAPPPTEAFAATYVPSPISPAPPISTTPVKQDLRSIPRARDAQGRLLRPDGKIDGRSVRYGKPPKSAGRRASAGDALKNGWAVANHPAQGLPQQPQVQSPPAPESHLQQARSPTVPTFNQQQARSPTVPTFNQQEVQSSIEPPNPSANASPRVPSPSNNQHQPPTTAISPALNTAASPLSPLPQEAAASPAHKAASPAVESPAYNAASPAVESPAGKSAMSPGAAARRAAKRVRYEKERDEEGNLLGRNGRVDGRSLRYKRAKDEGEGAAAQLEGAS